MQVCFTNLGCKLNQAELEQLARRFSRAGYGVTRDLASADLHVVNTCTVTHVAARDSRKIARRGRRLNPGILTVLTGCYVAEDEDQARAATGADLIVSNTEKDSLLEAVHDAFPELGRTVAGSPIADSPYGSIEFGNSRALVKIEDGCNMHCAFCIIPATRGRQRSLPPAAIVSQIQELSQAGYLEVVMTGVQISAYRWRGSGLFALTRRVLDETRVRRLRLTSIAPWQFDERLLDLFDSGRICRHVHLSLQSGSTATLDRMRRPYTAREFANLVTLIRRRVPGIAITTDVIAGFPGESDAEFEDSLAFVAAMGFARVHVFPYSVRPGTEAADLPDRVADGTKKQRVRRLLEVAAGSEADFVTSQLGLEVDVLWEAEKEGTWHGTSDNYIRTRTQSDSDLSRRLTRSVLSGQVGSAGLTTLTDRAENGAEHAA